MILQLDSDRRRFLATDLRELLDRHGSLRVIAALAVALSRRGHRHARISAEALPERLRRDIGLKWEPPTPRHWDIRL